MWGKKELGERVNKQERMAAQLSKDEKGHFLKKNAIVKSIGVDVFIWLWGAINS
jgi:hypothetical protein